MEGYYNGETLDPFNLHTEKKTDYEYGRSAKAISTHHTGRDERREADEPHGHEVRDHAAHALPVAADGRPGLLHTGD